MATSRRVSAGWLERMLAGARAVYGREIRSALATPTALIFVILFLILMGVFTFQLGQFFERGQADLRAFFEFHPWLYLFLLPALGMRVWSEERRSGSIELLLTLPVSTFGAVLGKFLATWTIALVVLALTFPMWWTVNFLGDPDNGAILTSYLGSLLLAGGFLSIAGWMSAVTRSQTTAFVLSVVVCLVLLLAGLEPVVAFLRGWAPDGLVEALSSMSFMTRFQSLSRGVIDARDVVFFLGTIAASLLATTWTLEGKRA